jgi:hypothetical protein
VPRVSSCESVRSSERPGASGRPWPPGRLPRKPPLGRSGRVPPGRGAPERRGLSPERAAGPRRSAEAPRPRSSRRSSLFQRSPGARLSRSVYLRVPPPVRDAPESRGPARRGPSWPGRPDWLPRAALPDRLVPRAPPEEGRPPVLGLAPRGAFLSPPPLLPDVPGPSDTLTYLQPQQYPDISEEGRSTLRERPSSLHVRRRPTLPRGPPRSTIGAEGLNFRVRNGTGCFPFAVTAETLWRCHRRLPGRRVPAATVSREPHSGRENKKV